MDVVDGVLVVDKPEGPTSHEVVARARRALGIRSIGHTGTLDPMATGVLVLVVGRATRLARFLSGHRKTYEAVVRLGLATDTWDRTGTPVPGSPAPVPGNAADLLAPALARFVGVGPQLPPPYSAKKVDGVRAHVLARRGREVAVAPAIVELHEARVTGIDGSLVWLTLVTSAGYYVRSLVQELGQELGCGACLEALRRTASGEFGLAEAVALAEVERVPDAAAARVVPMERLLTDLPGVVLDEAGARRAGHGNEIEVAGPTVQAAGGRIEAVRLLAPDGSLLAIARTTLRPGVLHPAVVLK
jgi:tRNA pseudouridine55 synthase